MAPDALKTFLVKNPDYRVFFGTGAGLMIGANEARVINNGGAEISKDMGVFTTGHVC